MAEAKSNLEATRDRGAVLDGIMEMKRQGKLPGVYGRLVRGLFL